ncbi:galactose mutarotase-like enzyme [Galbibacter orientalis DSM 19592]|uniref:Aldose 1-epimerase n=1 Tax=Galbibacter orientalis DSM 19592 TaxID=926559 RepID=I3CAS9_9FLAO|nr:aldose epimerase family protein [Galbibacter orientalis]EIJ40722.1 galactose mutarotase-like enzyme [Galbibacter orientalis DSM 19592]
MKTKQTDFGNIEKQDITLFTLVNNNGMEVSVTNYGATITAVRIPDVQGDLHTITCGFDSLKGYFSDDYLENSPYFGGTIGRYCSQIKNATFSLNGKTYALAKNAGENNLHGGVQGFDKKVWNARVVDGDDCGVEMSLKSTNLEEGFPGNVEVVVHISLNNANELSISYKATPDQDTPLSLTNHTYFNLSAFSETVENHFIKINANQKLVIDETGAATGEVIDLKGTYEDLTDEKRIGDIHEVMKDGFEHFYLINTTNSLVHVATIRNPSNKRSIEVHTTEPCMLFYTGKYTSNKLKRENGQQFGKYRGFCCETHRYPNGPNIENSPKSITKAGEIFKSSTVFKFNF